jgi:hypothetical protein
MAWNLGLLGAASPAVGAYELLETQILTGNQASVTFSNLNSTYGSTYQHLQIRAVSRNTRNVGYTLGEVFLEVNSQSSAYRSHVLTGNGSTVGANSFANSQGMYIYANPSLNVGANIFAAAVVDILDAFETSKNTTIRSLSGVHTAGTELGDDNIVELVSGLFTQTNAVDNLEIIADAANFVVGSRFSLYGMRSS